MNISYKWLKEYVDFDLTPQQTADALTSCGLEVDALEEVQTIKGGLKGLYVKYLHAKHILIVIIYMLPQSTSARANHSRLFVALLMLLLVRKLSLPTLAACSMMVTRNS